MVAVGTVQDAVDEVVDVVPVDDGGVAAALAVPAVALDRRARGGPLPVDGDRVLVHVLAVPGV